MRRYETIFIVRPTVGEDDITAVIDKNEAIIAADGGTTIAVEKWGLKKLAYTVKKETQGHYVLIDYASVPSSVVELERVMKIDDRVIKYMTVKLADSCDPEALKEEAVIGVTLYSAFMFAGQVVGEDVLVQHLREDPDKVKKGLEIITESMMIFVNACIEAGVDGFYASTQGGETTRFGGFQSSETPISCSIALQFHPAEKECT